jgi:hypothetical protein
MSENSWPDPARPGVPLNPERDGWHWVKRIGQKQAHTERWIGSHWWLGPSFGGAKTNIEKYEYLGPALTPAEVEARVAQARRDALEQVARYHDLMAKMAGSSTELQQRSSWEHKESSRDIRSERDIRMLREKTMNEDHIGVKINGVLYVKFEDAKKLREGWDKADAEIEKLRKVLQTARRDALDEAARRLEELHRQHKYNPKTGDGSEHDTGYYRALAEGAAYIRALKGEGDD